MRRSTGDFFQTIVFPKSMRITSLNSDDGLLSEVGIRGKLRFKCT